MNWQPPRYQEVKMDAEIGSYQPDGDTSPDGYIEGRDEAPPFGQASALFIVA